MPLSEAAALLAVYGLLINIVEFGLFAWDKRCAQTGNWRVPEARLLGVAVMGGALGAVLGQRILRHKTRKEPFRIYLLLIICLQIAALVALSLPQVRSILQDIAIAASS